MTGWYPDGSYMKIQNPEVEIRLVLAVNAGGGRTGGSEDNALPAFLWRCLREAEEAIKYYAGLFENSEIGMISRYGESEAESSKAKVNYAVSSWWEEILFGGSEEQVKRVNKAILEMKKFDLELLEKVRPGISN